MDEGDRVRASFIILFIVCNSINVDLK
jgi:hypothetical protein